MSFQFKKVEISDRDWILKILEKSPCPSLEYNFTTLFLWQKIYNILVAEHNGFLLSVSGKDKKSFLFPAGMGDIKSEIDFLIEYAKNEGFPVRFHSLSPENKEFLEKNYPEKFVFFEDRDSGDYVYLKESLKNLTGKKLASKRNHINRFLENYPEWVYEPITDENINEAMAMHNSWCEASGCDEEEGLQEETCAVRRAFKYYKELGLSGGLIRTRDGVCAFSMGDKLDENTFLVHIEKAYSEIQGAYPMINKQFVINNCEDFEFINREEDTGDEGLRRAKLSYQPVKIVKKFYAIEK